MNNYYVYVYIDPRNFEEFYYGKGKGSRKVSHLFSESDTVKSKRIAAIKKEGLTPIIRVITSNLTEDEAFLIEATLLWKLGKYTDNIASGRFTSKFRPHNTMHLELSNFDFQNGIYYYNVGEGPELLELIFTFSGMEDNEVAEKAKVLSIKAQNIFIGFIALQIKALAYGNNISKAQKLYSKWIKIFPNSKDLKSSEESIDSLK